MQCIFHLVIHAGWLNAIEFFCHSSTQLVFSCRPTNCDRNCSLWTSGKLLTGTQNHGEQFRRVCVCVSWFVWDRQTEPHYMNTEWQWQTRTFVFGMWNRVCTSCFPPNNRHNIEAGIHMTWHGTGKSSSNLLTISTKSTYHQLHFHLQSVVLNGRAK